MTDLRGEGLEGTREINQRMYKHICITMATDSSVVKVWGEAGAGWRETKWRKWGTSVIL